MKQHRRFGMIRLKARSEQGMALMSVLMLIMIITVLSTLVMGLVISQVRPTLFSNKNTRTIAAAQAGVDTAISQIRNAASLESGSLMGDIKKLPCRVFGPIEDAANGLSYEAEIRYYKEDPSGKDSAWRSSNQITCHESAASPGLRAVPYFAVVTSLGIDDSATVMQDVANRSIEATYTFPLTTRIVSGGQIMASNDGLCLVAAGSYVGADLKFEAADGSTCRERKDLSTWSWREDYMLHLSSTDSPGVDSLCISGRLSGGQSTVNMKLQKCAPSETANDTLGQRFSWEGNHTWQGQNITKTGGSGHHLVVVDGNAGEKRLAISSNHGSLAKPVPVPAVGKGNASKQTDQLVNQSLYGRCLDMTDEEPTRAYMITYPCKQDPSQRTGVPWNHKFYYVDPDPNNMDAGVQTKLWVQKNGDANQKYCLVSPTQNGMAAGSTLGLGTGSVQIRASDVPNSSAYPRATGGTGSCASPRATWTRYHDTTIPNRSWTFVDVDGNCLSAVGPKIRSEWNSVVVTPCDGKDYQKWNVPDEPIEGNVGSFAETTGRG